MGTKNFTPSTTQESQEVMILVDYWNKTYGPLTNWHTLKSIQRLAGGMSKNLSLHWHLLDKARQTYNCVQVDSMYNLATIVSVMMGALCIFNVLYRNVGFIL